MKTDYLPLNHKIEALAAEHAADIDQIQDDLTAVESAITTLNNAKWRLLYLDFMSLAFGALNTGANYSQGKGFTFSKAISWQTTACFSLTQSDNIESHVVPISNTAGKVQATNMRNVNQPACIIRVYILTQDPTLTVRWS